MYFKNVDDLWCFEFLVYCFVNDVVNEAVTDSGLFGIAVGAFAGAEGCEMVSNFLLHKLSEKYKRKNLTLYHDDGLAIFKNVSGPTSKKVKKIFF